MTSPVLRIGLTGGIGSGKSTVAHMWAEFGAAVIDADAISRQTTAAHGSALPAIAQAFGADFITREGALDRERMRSHVFSNPNAKQTLETIIHPLVSQETQRQAQVAIANNHRMLVFDVPLLVEAGQRWRAQLDRVLLIDCETETQVERVMARNHLSRDAVLQIIKAQASRQQKIAASDWVIYNEGIGLDLLRTYVQNLLPKGQI